MTSPPLPTGRRWPYWNPGRRPTGGSPAFPPPDPPHATPRRGADPATARPAQVAAAGAAAGRRVQLRAAVAEADRATGSVAGHRVRRLLPHRPDQPLHPAPTQLVLV